MISFENRCRCKMGAILSWNVSPDPKLDIYIALQETLLLS
jgi:hypothetical protein